MGQNSQEHFKFKTSNASSQLVDTADITAEGEAHMGQTMKLQLGRTKDARNRRAKTLVAYVMVGASFIAADLWSQGIGVAAVNSRGMLSGMEQGFQKACLNLGDLVEECSS